jgi:hypothetical protein
MGRIVATQLLYVRDVKKREIRNEQMFSGAPATTDISSEAFGGPRLTHASRVSQCRIDELV